MPYPKLMVMVSFCWKVNFLPNKIKNKFVLLTMSLKLTIKVVAFFLGHPVLDLLPQTFVRVCHIFLYISQFLSHFVEMHPHVVTLSKVDGTIF